MPIFTLGLTSCPRTRLHNSPETSVSGPDVFHATGVRTRPVLVIDSIGESANGHGTCRVCGSYPQPGRGSLYCTHVSTCGAVRRIDSGRCGLGWTKEIVEQLG